CGSFEIDFEDFEKKIEDNDVKMFILCNPHNPVGRVWTKEELLRIGNICKEHHVIVFSDEIHFDFIWEATHHIFQEVDPSFAEFTITGTAPSKTFNLAGLQQSNIFISNPEIRKKVKYEIAVAGFDEPNVFGLEAAQAAYAYGDEWYEAMKAYVEKNIDFTVSFVKESLPGVKLQKPEGTYLLWLDFRGLGLSTEELDEKIIHEAGLWLDSGKIFGKAGEGFQRINVACPRKTVQEALERLKKVR
ncbi:MAG: aminotransferase class I/II-fold pyridoxal phosphate-dependent enzyme, partial [Lachnospiraceae bacterium]|nr:aminotransferase class I/II-fold pyridoxal phosphate-dependent enzyme [Lachnospiraceae bacterium]